MASIRLIFDRARQHDGLGTQRSGQSHRRENSRVEPRQWLLLLLCGAAAPAAEKTTSRHLLEAGANKVSAKAVREITVWA